MKEKINKILWDFAQNKLTHDEATQQVLDLFAVSGELLNDEQILEQYKKRDLQDPYDPSDSRWDW